MREITCEGEVKESKEKKICSGLLASESSLLTSKREKKICPGLLTSKCELSSDE